MNFLRSLVENKFTLSEYVTTKVTQPEESAKYISEKMGLVAVFGDDELRYVGSESEMEMRRIDLFIGRAVIGINVLQ